MNNSADIFPDTFEFYLGALFEGEWFRVECKEGVLHYSAGWIFREKAAHETRCLPEAEQWSAFWREIERLGVWDWKPDYTDPGVCDGSGWELKMTRKGRSLHARGDNGYPGESGPTYSESSAFGQFITALKRLSGVREAFEELPWT